MPEPASCTDPGDLGGSEKLIEPPWHDQRRRSSSQGLGSRSDAPMMDDGTALRIDP